MTRSRLSLLTRLLIALAALAWGADQGISAAAKSVEAAGTAVTGTTQEDPPPAATANAAAPGGQAKGKVTRDEVYPKKFQKVAPSEQKAAAIRAAKKGMKPGVAGLAAGTDLLAAAVAPPAGIEGPGGIPHYFGPYGNFAFSPLPKGPLGNGGLTILDGGTGYAVNDVVPVADAYGSGSGGSLKVTSVSAVGAITGLVVEAPGSGYFAPVVDFENAVAALGSGAVASVTLNPLSIDPASGLKKFVDELQIPPFGVPDVVTYPGSDYYEIELREYSASMHTQLPPTRLRGYVQVNKGTDTSACDPPGMPSNPPKASVCTAANNTITPALISYLGPIVVAKGRVHGIQVEGVADLGDPRPVRVKFINNLPTGAGGDLFLPVDESVPGSGYGPALPGTFLDKFKQNRATIHLHGNNTVWLSDGNTHQWITPATETTPYPAGVSARNVPDMLDAAGNVICAADPDPKNPLGPGTSGCMNFYYTNAQSARLQFYHDHAHGITRLNVYGGEAAGYVLTDAVEQDMINGTDVTGVNPKKKKVLPGIGIPLVIQDRTFVDKDTIFAQDPTWNWGTGTRDANGNLGGLTPAVTGDLWFPHVYMTVQNPWDLTGTNGVGKWHYGPWFNPPTPECPGDGTGLPGCIEVGPVPNEYANPANPGYSPLEPPMRPGVPNPSSPGEAFLDTPIVNGVAYPYLNVPAGPVRFRILNAGNDRFLNLQLYKARTKDSWVFGTGVAGPGTANDPCGVTPESCTEVKMVPVTVNPANQFADTPSGVPDPAADNLGPPWWLIGTEGGFMPKPVVVPQQPIGWNLDMGYFAFGIVNQHSIFLGSAERADVIVDFSLHPNTTFILYNDSPAPVPAGAGVFDFYTGNGNQMDAGGAPNTLPGYGPNTRTIMQIRVGGAAPQPDVTLANLEAVFAKGPAEAKRGVFEVSQDPIIVPQEAYNSAYEAKFPTTAAEQFLQIGDMEKTFTPIGASAPVTIPLEMKAMHDEMGGVYDVMFGRMSGMLGLVNPSSNVHLLIPYPYAGPPVDLVKGSIEKTLIGSLADGTQIWRIFHNGVDTHPIHTHLFHTQIINRVDQSGQFVGDPVDPIEHGWKDTVRINPLEVTFLAMRPTVPTPDQVPFEVPDSIRLIDPALPLGATLPPPAPAGWFDPTGFQLEGADTPVNHYVNFGWEYVWHCHILSHEEMDMMHAIVFAVPPRPPSALVASFTGTVVHLDWVDNSIKEAGFTVQRATNETFTAGLATFSVGPGTGTGPAMFNDGSVALNTKYWYRVVANGEVVGDTFTPNFPTMSADSFSNTLNILTGTAPAGPAAPTTLTATAENGPRVRLTWRDNATNETGFVVERCTVVALGPTCSDFASIAAPGPRTGGSPVVTYFDTAVAFGSSYRYRVMAFNAGGNSTYVTLATPVALAPIPAAPAALVVSLNSAGTRATLNWTAATDPATFTLQRANNLGFTVGLSTTSLAGNLRTIDQNLTKNTVYYYRIRANNNIGGSSAWKNALPFPIFTGK